MAPLWRARPGGGVRLTRPRKTARRGAAAGGRATTTRWTFRSSFRDVERFVTSSGGHANVRSMMTTNDKGNVAELEIATAAVRFGVPVFKPLTEHTRSDLVLEIGGRL